MRKNAVVIKALSGRAAALLLHKETRKLLQIEEASRQIKKKFLLEFLLSVRRIRSREKHSCSSRTTTHSHPFLSTANLLDITGMRVYARTRMRLCDSHNSAVQCHARDSFMANRSHTQIQAIQYIP